MTSIAVYHGFVKKCSCGIADHPEKQGERACRLCFGRGFVAECMACDGKGRVEQKMAGGPGMMSATCTPCGGVGVFAVNKPKDWLEPLAKEELEVPQEAGVA
jgi:DnaJ-class molecular chaperone